jgi:type II secretory pathway pseudopilin PulG
MRSRLPHHAADQYSRRFPASKSEYLVTWSKLASVLFWTEPEAIPYHLKPKRPAVRKAFTVGELLVTIVIICILIGLIAPAAENVRRAASRMSCKNNLTQIGIAIQHYRDTHGYFPSGTVPNTQLSPDQRLSFYVSLLPYLERQNIHAKVQLAEPWDSPKNRAAVENANWYWFACNEWYGWHGTAQMNPSGESAEYLAITTYVGMAGVGADAVTLPVGAPGVGMFGYDRKLKLEDVKDGLANTILLIETTHELGSWMRGGPSTVRPIDPDAEQLAGEGFAFGGTHIRDRSFFRSREPDGFHIMLADSSVRNTQNAIHPDVLKALATVAGGEEVPGEW